MELAGSSGLFGPCLLAQHRNHRVHFLSAPFAKKQEIKVWPGILVHVLDGLLLLYLMSRNIIPVLGFVAGSMLIVRAFWNLSPRMRKATVRQLGFAEVYFGLAFLGLTAVGYWLGW